MKTWITQLRKGLLEFCILNVISCGETYGYELVQRLNRAEQLAASESTIYPILTRLKREGYVKVRTAPSSGGPPRRYFSLTTVGRYRIREMNTYWDEVCGAVTGLRDTTQRRSDNEDR